MNRRRGPVDTLVISLHPEALVTWQDVRDLDDEALEQWERQQEAVERRRAAEDRERRQREAIRSAQAATVRYDYSGYPIPD